MMDSPSLAPAKSLVPIAIAFVLVASVSPVHAQPAEPTAPPAAAPAPEGDTTPTQVPSTEPVEAPVAPAAPPPGPNTPTVGSEKPVAPGTIPSAEENTPPSWFTRAPLTVSVGEGDKRWALTFYGFVEASYIMDSTRSYSERIGAGLVARDDTYDGNHGRTQFSMRNTRLGLKFESPITGGVKPSAVIEADFYGPQTNSDTTPERTYYDAALFRIRHAYLLLENPYIDVLAGQTYDVFGWQNSRSTQFRLSHNFGAATGPVSVGLAAAAVRPVQRDSGVPDANAGIRLNVNSWKGMITTVANSGSLAESMFFQVSGVARQYKANAFAPPPTQTSNSATGWGVSFDVLIPVIPANDSNDRGNRLTLTGSFVNGTGIGDLININGGAMFPTLSNPAQASPAPEYDANVDQGLVTFDTQGVLHTIDWQAIKVGLQYYLPPSGRLFFTANYIQGHSANMKKLFPKGGAEIELLGRVADTTRYADVSLYWDATPAVRFGLTGAYTKVDYLDGDKPHNLRGMGIAQYAF